MDGLVSRTASKMGRLKAEGGPRRPPGASLHCVPLHQQRRCRDAPGGRLTAMLHIRQCLVGVPGERPKDVLARLKPDRHATDPGNETGLKGERRACTIETWMGWCPGPPRRWAGSRRKGGKDARQGRLYIVFPCISKGDVETPLAGVLPRCCTSVNAW